MADPIIRHVSPFNGDFVELPRASTVVIKKGWLLSLESNTIENMNADTEDVTFAGVAYTNHESGDPHNVTVLMKCIVDIDVTSATYVFGVGLKYTAGSATVDYSLVADANANTIAWSQQVASSAVTRLQVRFDVPVLGIPADKLFETVSA